MAACVIDCQIRFLSRFVCLVSLMILSVTELRKLLSFCRSIHFDLVFAASVMLRTSTSWIPVIKVIARFEVEELRESALRMYSYWNF